MKTEYSSTDFENFIVEDDVTGLCECFTIGTKNCLEVARHENITIFTKDEVEDIFNGDGIEVE